MGMPPACQRPWRGYGNPPSRVVLLLKRRVVAAPSFSQMHQAMTIALSHDEIVKRALASITDDGVALYHSAPHSIIQGEVALRR